MDFDSLYTEEELAAAPAPADFTSLFEDDEEVLAPPATQDNFDDLYAAELAEAKIPEYNVARGFTERVAEIAGSFVDVADQVWQPAADFFDYLDENVVNSGGLVWEEGDYLPTYLKPKALRRKKTKSKDLPVKLNQKLSL